MVAPLEKEILYRVFIIYIILWQNFSYYFPRVLVLCLELLFLLSMVLIFFKILGLMNKPVSTSSDVPTDGDIASKYKIHCPLEETESTSFLSSIYSFMLECVKSISGSSNRFPLDLGVNDCFTSHYYFTNLNLLVYIMFIAVLCFSIFTVAFFFSNLYPAKKLVKNNDSFLWKRSRWKSWTLKKYSLYYLASEKSYCD